LRKNAGLCAAREKYKFRRARAQWARFWPCPPWALRPRGESPAPRAPRGLTDVFAAGVVRLAFFAQGKRQADTPHQAISVPLAMLSAACCCFQVRARRAAG